jgi:hypothetical protein
VLGEIVRAWSECELEGLEQGLQVREHREHDVNSDR